MRRAKMLVVEGVNYDIDWREFSKGTSITIPCLDTKKARSAIKKQTEELEIQIVTKDVIEEGVRSLRVWRI
jgi:hypothetical protein